MFSSDPSDQWSINCKQASSVIFPEANNVLISGGFFNSVTIKWNLRRE